MLRVKMLKDDQGSQRGALVEQFEKGKEYDVTDELAACFVSTKSAEIIGDAAVEEKDAGAPDNKDAGDAELNKEEAAKSKRGKK